MSYRLDRAIELVDIHEWLSDYVDIKPGGGDEIRLKECPECGNDKYKLYVNTEKKLWICYVCEWGRHVRSPVQLMSKISGRSGTSIRLELLSLVPPAPSGDISAELMRAFDGIDEEVVEDDFDFKAVELPGTEKFSGITSQAIREYAKTTRGLTDAEIQRFCLRPAGSLTTPKGNDVFGPFLVVPVEAGGKFVSWQGRRVSNKEPRYISAANIKDWVYPLDEEFLSTYNEQGRKLYIVEGVFDAMGMSRIGLPAVCTFGTSVSQRQLSLIRELRPEEVCFAWDMGASKQVMRTVDYVSSYFPSVRAVVVDHPSGEKVDAGDALKDKIAADWIKESCSVENTLDVRSPEFFQWRLKKI